MRSTVRGVLVILTVIGLPACHQGQSLDSAASAEPTAFVADKPFVAEGKIEFDLDGGAYEIRPSADNHIRVAVSGTPGSSKVDVTISGNGAAVKIKDTPHSNFHAIVEVPAAADLVVHLTGGDLTLGAITGNKDVESYAGNVQIAVGDPGGYGRVDTAVKAGEIDARPFGGSKSGLMQEFTWTGSGKRTLRAHLGAGNLVLVDK